MLHYFLHLYYQQQNLKMHLQPGIKIIYLKNTEQYEQKPQNPQSNSINHRNLEQSFIYNHKINNIVNLSAKIQNLSPNKSINNQSIKKIIQNASQGIKPQNSAFIEKGMYTISQKSELIQVQKGKNRKLKNLSIEIGYQQSKLPYAQKQKSILNLLGKIQLKGGKKHKVTQKDMKKFKNAYISQRASRTLIQKKQGDHYNQQIKRNKSQLFDDFKNFLQNKKNQDNRLQFPKLDDRQLFRIKKLATINPQQLLLPPKIPQKLNLYNFLKQQNDQNNRKLSPKKTNKNMQPNDLNLDQILKILMDPNKPNHQFEWSKISTSNINDKNEEINGQKSRFNGGNVYNI